MKQGLRGSPSNHSPSPPRPWSCTDASPSRPVPPSCWRARWERSGPSRTPSSAAARSSCSVARMAMFQARPRMRRPGGGHARGRQTRTASMTGASRSWAAWSVTSPSSSPATWRRRSPFLRDDSFPDYELGFYKEAVVFDHSRFKCHYLSVDGCGQPAPHAGHMDVPPEEGKDLLVGRTKDLTLATITNGTSLMAKQRIADGEAFQMVVSRTEGDGVRWRPLVPVPGPPSGESLRHTCSISTSASARCWAPARRRLVTVKDGEVFTYPIAGTRPLGATHEGAQALQGGDAGR